ncbi:MAG: hypothetical protein HQL26_01925 [Candidatus Omnitrophica bacterium]|nr:hypothetical protein [Candidatus Omnitrophota bacterium]
MIQNKIKLLFIWVVCFFSAGSFASNSAAAISVSASSVQGGQTIKFTSAQMRLNVNSEVRIRVNSSEGRKYQVFQRLIDSLRNERGDMLLPNVMKAYTVSGSSASGTMYAQVPETVGISDQLLYSSSPSGASDSFTIAYRIDPEQLRGSGNFSSRIQYLVRTIGGSGQGEAILNINIEAPSELEMKVTGGHLREREDRSYNAKSINFDVINIEFKGNHGQDMRIYQEFSTYPRNDEGMLISHDAFRFRTENASSSPVVQALSGISSKRVLVYSGKQDSEKIAVIFDLNKDQVNTQKAGKYRGNVRYIVESVEWQKTYDLDLVIDIKPVFKIDVQFPDGGMNFSKVVPDSPPQVREALIKVESNLNKPYVVLQHFISPLTNEHGMIIDKRYFTTKQEILPDQSGRVKDTEFNSADIAETPVYFSDSKGSSAQFKIFYRLLAYPEINAGNYTTSVIYTLGEK